MKFKKLITSSIVIASLLGISLGSSSLNAAAGTNTDSGSSDSSNPSDTNMTSNTSRNNDESTTSLSGTKTSGQSGTKDGVTKNRSSDTISNTQSTSADAGVKDGILKLDSVPNLHFASKSVNSNSYSNILYYDNNNNNGSDNNGTNNQGILQVTDNRNTSNSGNGPWSVQASLGQFNKSDSSSSSNASDDDWTIDLNPKNITNYGGQIPTASDAQLGSKNGYTTIMDTNNDNDTSNNHDGYGTNRIIYDSDTAKLTTPYNIQIGDYNANINWTLTANATTNANSTNSTGSQK